MLLAWLFSTLLKALGISLPGYKLLSRYVLGFDMLFRATLKTGMHILVALFLITILGCFPTCVFPKLTIGPKYLEEWFLLTEPNFEFLRQDLLRLLLDLREGRDSLAYLY